MKYCTAVLLPALAACAYCLKHPVTNTPPPVPLPSHLTPGSGSGSGGGSGHPMLVKLLNHFTHLAYGLTHLCRLFSISSLFPVGFRH